MKRTGTKYTKRMRSKICIWGWQRSTCLGVMSRRTKKIWVSSGVKKTSSRNKSTQKWHNFCKKIASISSFTSPTCSKDDYLFFKSCFFLIPIYYHFITLKLLWTLTKLSLSLAKSHIIDLMVLVGTPTFVKKMVGFSARIDSIYLNN